jgi:hypothetical protein
MFLLPPIRYSNRHRFPASPLTRPGWCLGNGAFGSEGAGNGFSRTKFYAKQVGERGRQRILTEWNYEAQFSRGCARTRQRPDNG